MTEQSGRGKKKYDTMKGREGGGGREGGKGRGSGEPSGFGQGRAINKVGNVGKSGQGRGYLI